MNVAALPPGHFCSTCLAFTPSLRPANKDDLERAELLELARGVGLADPLARARAAELLLAHLLGGADFARSTQAAFDMGYFAGRKATERRGGR